MSQPAVSRALGQLRRALGERIVVRNAAGSVLTPHAEALKPLVSDALAAIQPGVRTGGFRSGDQPDGCSDRHDGLWRRSHPRAPGGDAGQPCAASRSGGRTLGAGDVCRAGNRAPRFRALCGRRSAKRLSRPRDLFTEGYSCLMRTGHPVVSMRRADGSIAIDDLVGYPRAVMLYPDNRHTLADDVLARLSGAPIPKPAIFSTPYFLSGPLAVEGVRSHSVRANPRRTPDDPSWSADGD